MKRQSTVTVYRPVMSLYYRIRFVVSWQGRVFLLQYQSTSNTRAARQKDIYK